MTIRALPVIAALSFLAISPVPAFCQQAPPTLPDRRTSAAEAISPADTADPQPAPTVDAGPAPIPSLTLFLHDVGTDYKAFFSKGVAIQLGIGGAAAAVTHIWDDDIDASAANASDSVKSFFKGGEYYGGPAGQYSLAAGWWVVSHFAGSAKGSDAGRDLVRAQISATSWTYLMKFATNRTRPNGDPRAFPSGHSSSTFATATVLQRHYGWKLGLPFYLLGVYAGASRPVAQKHWASDVVFGAAVGVASGYTVTRHLGAHTVTVAPAAYSGGGAGILMTVSATP